MEYGSDYSCGTQQDRNAFVAWCAHILLRTLMSLVQDD